MEDNQLLFENREAFRKWLRKNHQICPGIWLVFEKNHQLRTLTANQALEEALCFGWIDGQIQSLGAEKYLKRFTPRRKDSVWSERNRKIAQKLTEEGVMTNAGRRAIVQAQTLGKWNLPRKEPISEAQIEILVAALSGTEKALSNYLKMSPSARKTYAGYYLEAKQEDTRKKRLGRIIERLNENRKPM